MIVFKIVLVCIVLLMGLLFGVVLLTYALYFLNYNGVRDHVEGEGIVDFPECEQASD